MNFHKGVFCEKLGDPVTHVYVIPKCAFRRSQCLISQELSSSRNTGEGWAWRRPGASYIVFYSLKKCYNHV